MDAAIDMHAKGVFHRDIKLQNVLLDFDSGVPRVRVIDLGCGSFSTENAYHFACGTVTAPHHLSISAIMIFHVKTKVLLALLSFFPSIFFHHSVVVSTRYP